MSVQIFNPKKPLNKVIRQWAAETTIALQGNFKTQQIFPFEVFPGWKQINQRRKDAGLTYSTGEGYRSLVAVGFGNTPGDAGVKITYNDYLRFVDMGVAGGRPYSSVEHARKARHTKRYVQFWEPTKGESHRPAIMMEARHLQHRMQIYLEDFYGWEGRVQITRGLTNLDEIDLGFGG